MITHTDTLNIEFEDRKGKMKTYIFRAEVEQDPSGRWGAEVPSLPGCATEGDTKEEALEALREAAQAYLEVMREHGDPLPLI